MSTITNEAPAVAVGVGATLCWWSDRRAGTIISVSPSGKRIVVQEDTAIRTDGNGVSSDQRYEYERNPKGVRREFSLRKNGRWVEVGSDLYDGVVCTIGVRRYYYDYSF